MQTEELKPCPWCGGKPDVTNNASFVLTDGVKWGALQCCGTGPEVRTGYQDVPHWKDEAIAAWNRRTPVSGEVLCLTDKMAWELAVETFGTTLRDTRHPAHVEIANAAEAGEFARAVLAKSMSAPESPIPTTTAGSNTKGG